jgi:hypothetical protein
MAVPKFPCEEEGEPDAFRNAFDLLERMLPPRHYTFTNPPESPFVVEFLLANAGAAATPVNLIVSRLAVLAEPPGGGG